MPQPEGEGEGVDNLWRLWPFIRDKAQAKPGVESRRRRARFKQLCKDLIVVAAA